jgi:hypothetical protein
MEISDERKEKIWKELVENRRLDTNVLPHERTKKMLAEEYHLTFNQVESFVTKMLLNGLITKRSGLINGKKCVVYSIVEK